MEEGACQLGKEVKKWIPSPPQRVIGPAAYYPFSDGGIMKEPSPSLLVAGAFNFFLVETRLSWGHLKKKSLDSSPRLDKYSLGRHVHEDEKERSGSKRRRNSSHQGSTPEARGGVEPPTFRFGIERATPCATRLATCKHSPR